MSYKILVISVAFLSIFASCSKDKTTEPTPNNSTTVTIGTQVWMKRNLDVVRYRNGDSIPQVTDSTKWENLTTGAWCYYDNDANNDTTYGKLYNWHAVNDSRGLAPTGWHVASYDEWSTLTIYLGGDSLAGGKLKEAGEAHWYSPNTGATNENGFSALPGGYRGGYGTFLNIGYCGYWWSSSTEDYTTFAWSRYMNYDNTYLGRNCGSKGGGFSVRCLRD